MKSKYYIATITLLILLFIYSYSGHAKHYPSISDFIKEPSKYDNVITEQQVKVYSINEDYFTAKSKADLVIIKHPHIRMPKYGHLTFIGTYNADGTILATDIRYNDYNDFKYFFSIIGLFLFLSIFLKEWKITFRGFESA